MNAPNKKIEAASFSADVVNAFSEIEGAAKDKLNPHFKSKYADLTSVIDAIKPVLSRHNLAFYQRPQPSESGILVQTVLRHASGEEIDLGTLYVPANKQDPQGFGSAMTYARRYALMTAFGVPAEDDDGNAAAKATARPTTGETPPEKRVQLDGPFKSPSALKGAIKAFVDTLSKMQDLGEFTTWMETPDVVELEKQAMRDLPAWWETGDGMPAEFVPVSIRIHQKKRDLEEIENIHSNTRTVIDAG
jgi:hypothetical protein